MNNKLCSIKYKVFNTTWNKQ